MRPTRPRVAWDAIDTTLGRPWWQMREPPPSARHRLAPLPGPTRDRLLRAVDELRALERERQGRRAVGGSADDVSRLVEAKAREIFRLSQDTEGHERRH